MRPLPFLLVAVAASGVGVAQDDDLFPYGVLLAEQSRASFTLLGAGARAAGMGGAFTAVADDATAASFNPAGLAQMLIPEASAVVVHQRLDDRYRDFYGLETWFGEAPELASFTDAAVSDRRTDFNFASLTWPFRASGRRWAAQLSAQRLVNFDYQGAIQVQGLDEAGVPVADLGQTSRQSGAIGALSASAAVELTQRTLLGVTVNRWTGDWTVDSTSWRGPVGDPQWTTQLRYLQEVDFAGFNVDLGLLLRYPRLNVGVRYRTPLQADANLHVRTHLIAPGGASAEDILRADLDWPATLNLGLAFKLSDRWLVAADYGRTDWSGLAFDLGEGQANFFDLLPPLLTTAGVAEDFRLGTELLLFAGTTVVPLRAGLFREDQPTRNLVTGGRVAWDGVSVGVGVKRGVVAFDLAARYRTSSATVLRFFLPDEVADPDEFGFPNAAGTLDRDEWSVYASVIVQIPRGSKGADLLYRMFVGPLPKDD